MSLYGMLDDGLTAFTAALTTVGIDTTNLRMTRQGRQRFVLEFYDIDSGAAVRPWGSTAYTPTEILELMQFAVTALELPPAESGARHRDPATSRNSHHRS